MNSYIVVRFKNKEVLFRSGNVSIEVDTQGFWIDQRPNRLHLNPDKIETLEVSHNILVALVKELKAVSFDVTCPENDFLESQQKQIEQQAEDIANNLTEGFEG